MDSGLSGRYLSTC